MAKQLSHRAQSLTHQHEAQPTPRPAADPRLFTANWRSGSCSEGNVTLIRHTALSEDTIEAVSRPIRAR